MKKVAIISDVGVRFGYPHYTDLAELFVRNGCAVEIIMPVTPGISEWNAGRGFSFHFINEPRFKIPGFRNLRFLFLAAWRSRKFDSLLVSLQPSLVIALFYSIFFRKKTAYYIVELITFGKINGGAYSIFQRLLPFTSVRVLTTGLCRSRAFKRATGLRKTPEVLALAALKNTRANISRKGPTLAEQVRAIADRPDAIVVALNGALSDVNCLDLLLDADIPASSGVLIAMVGTLQEPWRTRVAEARQRTGNYIHVGELDGNRYDLIDFLKGSDLGLVIKRYDRAQTPNDRLYTPNKLYDFIAAGVPMLCSRQNSMAFIPAERLGYQLPNLEVETLRHALLSLPEKRAELKAMQVRVTEQFHAMHNLETAAQELVSFLS